MLGCCFGEASKGVVRRGTVCRARVLPVVIALPRMCGGLRAARGVRSWGVPSGRGLWGSEGGLAALLVPASCFFSLGSMVLIPSFPFTRRF